MGYLQDRIKELKQIITEKDNTIDHFTLELAKYENPHVTPSEQKFSKEE